MLSFREHPRVLLCCSAPTFMLFHSSLFLKFVNNFEILCEDDDLHLKLSLHFKISNFDVRRHLSVNILSINIQKSANIFFYI